MCIYIYITDITIFWGSLWKWGDLASSETASVLIGRWWIWESPMFKQTQLSWVHCHDLGEDYLDYSSFEMKNSRGWLRAWYEEIWWNMMNYDQIGSNMIKYDLIIYTENQSEKRDLNHSYDLTQQLILMHQLMSSLRGQQTFWSPTRWDPNAKLIYNWILRCMGHATIVTNRTEKWIHKKISWFITVFW